MFKDACFVDWTNHFTKRHPNLCNLGGEFTTYGSNGQTNQMRAKVAPDAYATAVKGACSAEAQALSDALVKFDTAMGTKRPAAVENAARDVDDYRLTSEERYRDLNSPQ